MATPPREGTASGGLTEDEDVLQVLEEGALKLLLLFSGQLLGDCAAVTQASPEPVGAREARGRSEGETEAHGGAGTLPGCVSWKPHLIPYPLVLGRNLENAVSFSLWESYLVGLTPEHLRLFSMEPFSSSPACPATTRPGRGHQVALCRAHLFSSTRTFSFRAFCCSLSCWFLAHSSSSLWASLWGDELRWAFRSAQGHHAAPGRRLPWSWAGSCWVHPLWGLPREGGPCEGSAEPSTHNVSTPGHLDDFCLVHMSRVVLQGCRSVCDMGTWGTCPRRPPGLTVNIPVGNY